jgi:hypothetical protein
LLRLEARRRAGVRLPYFGGGAGANPSRLRPGSGLGLGFGAFLTSFLPLSLLPMGVSLTQKGRGGEGKSFARIEGLRCALSCNLHFSWGLSTLNRCVRRKSPDSRRHHGFWACSRHCVRQTFSSQYAQHFQAPRKAGLAGAVGDEEEWRRRIPRIL